MTITANGLRAGMYLAIESAYIKVERVAYESCGMIRATVRDVTGNDAPVMFHRAEFLAVGA